MIRISTLIVLLSCIYFRVDAQKVDDRPNLIFILTDDHRYDQLGYTGNKVVQTPNIDKLASQGTLFTNAYVTSAICTPSRVSMFLSQYERKHGVNFNSGTSVSDEAWEDSYPVVLRKSGYYTGYIGKNHAPVGKGGYQSGVMEKSFDYWYGGHGHLTFYPKQRHKIFTNAKNNTQVEIINEGVKDFMSNEHKLNGAIRFLDTRPKDKPFLLSVNFNVPHGASTRSMKQLETDPDLYRSAYRNKEIPLVENYIAKEDIINPKLPESVHHYKDRQFIYDWVDDEEQYKEIKIRQYQTITGVDNLVGELLASLKEKNLDKNTIIVFTSDHGLFSGEYGLGGKALCYQICTHVPFIIYNPMVKKKARGQVVDALVQTIDIAPTLLAYAGVQQPESYQGISLNGLVSSEETEARDYVFTENLWSTTFGNPRCESVQDKEWKYIRYYQNNNISALRVEELAKEMNMPVNNLLYGVHDTEIAVYRSFIESPLEGEKPVYEELYNLKIDPEESTNLADRAEHQQILSQMRAVWKEKIILARGTKKPQVYRYTVDSKNTFVKPE